MSTAGRPRESAPGPDDVATACRDAGLVRLLGTADGDALATVGLLARALADTGVPFQASLTPVPTIDTPRTNEADATVTVGATGGDLAVTETPSSPVAHAAARELGADPDPLLALAGVIAAGRPPGEFADLLDAARERGVERRAGVGVPTEDLADGLAHTTLAHTTLDHTTCAHTTRANTTCAHTSFSGDPEAARGALSGLEEETGRRVGSLLALATAGDAPPRAAEAVERALRPYAPGGPFATLAGYADVLDAVARERPGTGLALVLEHGGGEEARADALAAWREHARRAHAALDRADTSRYAGLVVAHTDGPVGTVARLLRDFRSPEPVAVAVSDGEAATAAPDGEHIEPALREAASAADGAAVARGPTGYACDLDDTESFVAALREAL